MRKSQAVGEEGSCALRARQRDIPLESAKERWAGGTFESAVVVARVRLRLDS